GWAPASYSSSCRGCPKRSRQPPSVLRLPLSTWAFFLVQLVLSVGPMPSATFRPPELPVSCTWSHCLPCGDPFDSGYKRLYYCRSADDLVSGLIGSYADAERVQQEVRRFIQDPLKLRIAEEKAPIRHSKKGVPFVGDEVRTYSGNRAVRLKRGTR